MSSGIPMSRAAPSRLPSTIAAMRAAFAPLSWAAGGKIPLIPIDDVTLCDVTATLVIVWVVWVVRVVVVVGAAVVVGRAANSSKHICRARAGLRWVLLMLKH